MSWRVARSLDQLLAQLNALAPDRSRVADGSIGDAAHQAQGSDSDHNPWFVLNGQPLVTARDFTHDPAGGLDCNKLAAALIEAKDPRVKYLIWQGRLMDSRAVAGNGYRPWTWQPSSGHYQHLHLSVMANASADDTRPWSLPGLTKEGSMGELFTPAAKAAYDETHHEVKDLYAVIVGKRTADGRPALQQHVDFVVDELTRRIVARLAAVEAQLAAMAGALGDDEAKLLAAIRAQPTGGQVDVPQLAAALAPLLPQGVTPDQIQDALRSVLRTGVDDNPKEN